jgi:hypothetical protein
MLALDHDCFRGANAELVAIFEKLASLAAIRDPEKGHFAKGALMKVMPSQTTHADSVRWMAGRPAHNALCLITCHACVVPREVSRVLSSSLWPFAML